MALGMNVALRNSRLDEITTLQDAGAGASLLEVYDGVRPATGGAITTLLAQLTFTDPAAAAAAAGVLTYSAIIDDASADATGTASWFRVTDSVAGHVYDGDVSTSGADLNLNTTSIVAGGTVSITSAVLTEGNA